MTQYVQAKVEKLEQPVTARLLSGLIILSIFLYACFINSTIANIVSSKNMQLKISQLTSSVSGLESQYLVAKSNITSDYALAMGFTQPKSETIYISRVSVGALSFNR